MSDPSRLSRWPAAAVAVIALAWLVAAAATLIAVSGEASALDAFGLARYAAGVVLRLAPPLAIAIAAVALLRAGAGRDAAELAELEERTAAAARAGAAVRDGLLDIDATLAAIGGRLDAVRAAAAAEVPRIAAAAREIEATTGTLTGAAVAASTAAHEVGAAVPAAQRHAEALAATLAATGVETARQLDEVETMLAGVAVRHDEVHAKVIAIEASAAAAAATIDGRAAALDVAVDAALGRTAAAVASSGEAVDAQARTMLGSIDAARGGLDAIGGATAAAVAARIDRIVAATGTLGAQLDAHDHQTATMVATIERSFAVLEKRLAHATAMGSATLDGFHARMAVVRDLADGLNPQLAAVHTTLSAAEASAARLAPVAATVTTLGAALAASTGPADDLALRLAAARADVDAIETAAHGSALAAASQLIEVLGRVGAVADTARGRLREALTEVVAEAEAALADAGERTAARAFADPIRHEIAGLEGAAALAGEAAQATADRIAARLLGLTATVATVERRLNEAGR